MNQPVIPQIKSYKQLRQAVGYIGIALPVVIIIGGLILQHCFELQGSISKYYHTIMRNYFVGSLCAVALFLWFYRGYDKDPKDKFDIGDNLAGNLAALFALGVAFFPCRIEANDITPCITSIYDHKIIGIIHLASAFLFFMTLAYFSIFQFTKGKKPKKNKIYRFCGYTIVVSLLLIVVYILILEYKRPFLDKLKPMFILETIALWAFGISWLVKGEALLKKME